MNANRVVVGDLASPLYTFENDQLAKVEVVLRVSYSGDELAYDQLFASTFAGENGGTLDIPDGTPIYYYLDGNLVGKFFAQPTTRENRIVYNISAISAIGMLSKQPHRGGLYNGETFEDVAADIIGGLFPFTCSAEVAPMQVYGYLPNREDARENLHELLFAFGVMVVKDSNGEVVFAFANPDIAWGIDDDRMYMDGTITPVEKSTLVRVTAHNFVALPTDVEYTLFDNVGLEIANNQLVVFENAPAHDLQVTGALQVIESGVNYAVVSGSGALTGKQYSHIQQVMEKGTPGAATIDITDKTLINLLNVSSVVDRLLNYYNVTNVCGVDVQHGEEKPGIRVTFTNPHGEPTNGFIKEQTITALATAKARTSILTDFVPTGGGNTYQNVDILTQNGEWTVPADVEEIFLALIGGGQGGEGAQAGADGGNATYDNVGDGGDPGERGAGGQPGKVLVRRISVTPGQTFAVTVGAGGDGGAPVAHGVDKNAGQLGTASTFGAETSDDGTVQPFGFVDIISGSIYALQGENGSPAGKGGTCKAERVPNDTIYPVQDGGSITHNGITFIGGRSNPRYQDGENAVWMSDGRGHYYLPGGGSGAVFGANGTDGQDGRVQSIYVHQGTIFGGKGGDAPTPTDPMDATTYGCGGPGGNAGGGGGGAGAADNYDAEYGYTEIRTNRGLGGPGTRGGKGAPGAVLIYY